MGVLTGEAVNRKIVVSKMPQHIVYFLGAGASKPLGYPVTWEIMPEILENLLRRDLFRLGDRQTPSEKKQEKELLASLLKIYPGLRNVDPQKDPFVIPNITEVLSFVDHCYFYDIPPHPGLSDGKLTVFRQLLNRAITELLMAYEELMYTDKEQALLDAYIGPIKKEKKTSDITVITTNYDLVIDGQFKEKIKNNRINFGIPYRDVDDDRILLPPERPLFNYYKLHGSLNWLACNNCGHYYINPWGSIAHQPFRRDVDSDNTCYCSDRVRLRNVLVAPSLVRDIRDPNLLQIWKGAMEAIRTADKLIFIGYSLPAEDLAIKSIIMRGLYSRSKESPLRVDVVQTSDKALPNYRNIFGKNIRYFNQGLEAYLLR